MARQPISGSNHGDTVLGPPPGDEVSRLDHYITEHMTEPWAAYPGGWPGQIESALIDAVLSIRARYGSTKRGVPARVAAWREHCGRDELNDLEALAKTDPRTLQGVIGSQALRGGLTKAEGIVVAANNFTSIGVRHAADLRPNEDPHRRAYVDVRGLGKVTWHYFTMLLGTPSVKADTWILRFTEKAIGRGVDPETARTLIHEVAKRREVDARALDHAIWSYARRR